MSVEVRFVGLKELKVELGSVCGSERVRKESEREGGRKEESVLVGERSKRGVKRKVGVC